jgi:ferredoxin-NADP reductase
MSMLRHRRRTMPEIPMRLVYSVRSSQDVIYADELGDDVRLTYTRDAPAGWSGHAGRIDQALIADALVPDGLTFICGSARFVAAAEDLVLAAGVDPARIRTERFGPTG